MVDILNVVKQTNNTLLLEKINEEKDDLITLLSDTKDKKGLDDSKLAEIYDKLAVRSFEEFLDKFAPTLYLMFDNNMNPIYSTTKLEYLGVIKQKLDLDNKILKTLIDIIENKGSSGEVNIDFSYKDVLELISPKSLVEDAKKLRKELYYNERQYNTLDKENPKRKEYASNIKKIRKKIVELYREDPTALIPLAIEDAKEKIKAIDNFKSSDDSSNGVKILGYPRFSESTGSLEIIPFSEEKIEDTKKPQIESKTSKWIENDLNSHLPTQYKNSFTKELIISSFSEGNLPSNKIELEQLKNNHDNMLNFYKRKVDKFMEIAKPIIQALLGVKVFFDQTQNSQKPLLLVTNNSVKELSSEKELFKKFIDSASKDLSKKIWLAILPNVQFNDITLTDIEDDDLDEAIIIDETEEESEDKLSNSITFVKPIMKILADSKVHTFFNFHPSKETNLNALHMYALEPILEKISKFEPSPYSIFCMPNITVLPDDKSVVYLGDILQNGEPIKSVLNGVYIDASYIGAGLVSAWLNPKELKSRGFEKVSLNTPGVRFDIERGDNSINFTTTLGIESSKSYSDELLKSLNEKGFGFTFSSDYIIKDGKRVDNIYLLNARSLYEKNGKYQPIYKRLVIDTLEVYLRHTTGGKLDKIKDFIKMGVRELEDDKEMVNGFIQEGDSIELSDDKQTINFNFAGMAEVVDIEIKEN